MALQTTKPTIPTKDKNSADPDIRKLRDSELNDIVNAFEKVDENFGELEQEIGGKQDNLGITDETTHLLTPKEIREGVAVETKYQTETEVSNLISNTLGSENVLKNANADQFSIGDETKIKSILISGNSKIIDFTDSKDFGTLIDPIHGEIDVRREGGINKNKVVLISASVRTPAILVDPLIESWGVKPSWMIVKGDSYSTGFNDVNELTFTFHKVWKEGGVSIQNAVVCEIVSHINFSQEVEPWYENLLINAMMNDNRSLSANDTLINNVVWDTADSEVAVEGGASATFTDLGSGNYSIRTGQTGSTRVVCILSASALEKIDGKAITVISRFRGGNTAANKVIASNIDTANTSGFAFYHVNTDQRIRFEQGLQDATNRVAWLTNVAPNSETWIEAAATFKGQTARIWGRIPSESISFGAKATKTDYASGRNINSGLSIRLDQTTSASSANNWKETDYMIIYGGNEHLNGQTIQRIMDNPQNAAKIIQDWEHPSPIIFVTDPQGQIGGYAGLYNGGIGVSGGREGRIIEYSDMNRLLEDLITADYDSKEEYRYIGNDVTLSDSVFTITARKNKSIRGLGQKITNGEFRTVDCENIIWQNFERIPTANNTFDCFTVNNCIGVVFDHILMDGLGRYQSDFPTTHVDGLIDIGVQSDLITISNCVFKAAERGMLIGYSNVDTGIGGKLRVTISTSLFKDLRQRPPFVRGTVHLINNLYDYDVSIMNNPANLGIVAGDNGLVYIDNNYYERGHRVYRFETGLSETGGIKDVGSFRNDLEYVVSASTDIPYNSELVTFNPSEISNYRFPIQLMSPTTARDYVLANAGANLIIEPIV
jgi:pectate lyase